MKKGLLAVVLLGWIGVAEAGIVTVYSPAGTITGNYTTIQELKKNHVLNVVVGSKKKDKI